VENQFILALEEEETNLELHVKLCEQRYRQLTSKLDHVDHRLDRLETHIVDIKDSLSGLSSDNDKTYLKWAGFIIGLLSTFCLGLVAHLILK